MIWGIVSIGALIAVLAASFLLLRRLQANRTRDVMARFSGRQMWALTTVNFFGQQSKGRGQIRGNGVLALVDDGIYFELWAPRRTLHIPYRHIIGVSTPSGFLGKFSLRSLLKVDFRDEAGERDAAAWYLRDPHHYVSLLNDLCRTARGG